MSQVDLYWDSNIKEYEVDHESCSFDDGSIIDRQSHEIHEESDHVSK